MRRETIDRAREKAMEFIDATHEVEAEYLEKGPVVFVAGSPATGNLRRRSLDLSRALTEMRKP